jgi:hypothetical protein
MKSLIAPLLATASFATFMICGMVAASSLDSSYRPHDFQNLNAGLWTSTPVRVNQGNQNFKRLAAATPAAAPDQTVASHNSLIDHTAENAAFAEAAAGEDPANQMCQQRYRSYRLSDNTCQPLSGGPRRACELSQKSTTAATMQAATASATVSSNSSPNHQAWCQARYRLYNPVDDTYQPFGGGSRRACAPPVENSSSG